MREIKFRVWDSLNNLMLNNETALNILRDAEFNKKPISNEYNILQYTWLKDKNWKEIYEWDIMGIIDKYEDNWKIITNHTVVWIVELKNYDDGEWYYNKYHYWYMVWNNETLPDISKQNEIIWNIYENKDLLN